MQIDDEYRDTLVESLRCAIDKGKVQIFNELNGVMPYRHPTIEQWQGIALAVNACIRAQLAIDQLELMTPEPQKPSDIEGDCPW